MSDDLKAIVAREHGLDRDATQFLSGSTLGELEESAAALANLLGERREPEPAADASDLFSGAAARKAQRQGALMGALTGRPPQQPRDQRGRWRVASTGFDGGAREPAKLREDPVVGHNRWLVAVLRSRSADAGVRF